MASEFTGRILHVNLTTGTVEVESPPESFYRTYLGGSAMGLYYILNGMQPGTDGLDPANVMTWMDSLLTGTPIAGQSRITINARSPLTDGVGDSQGGGFLPAELRFAGFTGIVIRGRATEPVYLWIHDGEAELRPAGHLWGKTTTETVDTLRAELGDPRIEVAAIGPSGEKLVRLAAIINMGNRANGRTGMGAVMGSKLLKAVAVRGTHRKAPLADPAALGKLARWGSREIPNNGDVIGLRNHGTESVLEGQHAAGGLPTFNYNAGQFEHYEAISGETMTATILTDTDTCYSCAVRCKRVVTTEFESRPVEPRHGGPEYETAATFGSYCGIDSLPAISLANKICNEHGLDTIGTGATIAWTMECFEHGLVTEADLGFRAPFGDAAAMIRLAEMIATRDGFGDILANGSRRAADLLGKGPRVPDHGQGRRGAGPHAAGQALAGGDLRGQPVRRRPPVLRARPDDRGGRQRAVPGAPQAARASTRCRRSTRWGPTRSATRCGPSSSTRSSTPPRCASSCGAPRGSCSDRRRRSTSCGP